MLGVVDMDALKTDPRTTRYRIGPRIRCVRVGRLAPMPVVGPGPVGHTPREVAGLRRSTQAFAFRLGLGLVLAGCGADPDESDAGARMAFSIEMGGQAVPCASRPEIEVVEVTFFAEDGVSTVVGYPQPADCASGTFAAPGAGTYVLEITARGIVEDDPEATLFATRRPVRLPDDLSHTATLAPEVAYLDVDWTFGEVGFQPCASEVAIVEASVSSWTRLAYEAEYGCTERPVSFPTPLATDRRYDVKVGALSPEGVLIYYAYPETRVFAPGTTDYSALLEPLDGHRVRLDWRFAIGAERLSGCDDDRVRVDQLVATVDDRIWGTSDQRRFACSVARPHILRSAMFRYGSEWAIELVGQGRERFVGSVEFTMPARDWQPAQPLLLHAVGTATVAYEVRSSTCAEDRVDHYTVEVAAAAGDTEPAFVADALPVGVRAVPVTDLPFGEYVVRITQMTGASAGCTLRQPRTVDARDNDWDPFIF